MDLKYWFNGVPILPSDSSSTKELKYWFYGVPYTFIESAAAAGNIQTINGILWANVKKFNTIAKASIKKINTISAN